MRWIEHQDVKQYFTTRTENFTMHRDFMRNWIISANETRNDDGRIIGCGLNEWAAWMNLIVQIDLQMIKLQNIQEQVKKELHKLEQECKRKAARNENHV